MPWSLDWLSQIPKKHVTAAREGLGGSVSDVGGC